MMVLVRIKMMVRPDGGDARCCNQRARGTFNRSDHQHAQRTQRLSSLCLSIDRTISMLKEHNGCLRCACQSIGPSACSKNTTVVLVVLVNRSDHQHAQRTQRLPSLCLSIDRTISMLKEHNGCLRCACQSIGPSACSKNTTVVFVVLVNRSDHQHAQRTQRLSSLCLSIDRTISMLKEHNGCLPFHSINLPVDLLLSVFSEPVVGL
jgi:hypothetical protein